MSPGQGRAGTGAHQASVPYDSGALFVPDQAIDTLFVPARAPWLKPSEAIHFVRAVDPGQAIPIHDAGLSELGAASSNGWHGRTATSPYRYLAPRRDRPRAAPGRPPADEDFFSARQSSVGRGWAQPFFAASYFNWVRLNQLPESSRNNASIP